MPELPEVETTKNAILPFKGKTLKKIIVNNPSLRWPVDEKLINKIKDVKVLSTVFLNSLKPFRSISGNFVNHSIVKIAPMN